MKAESLLALVALLAAVPAAARTRAPKSLPDPRVLLKKAFSAPELGYSAYGRIQYFAPGRKPKGLSMTVEVLPDGRARCERKRSAKKPAELVIVDDGRERSVWWPKLETLWSGPSAAEPATAQAARFEALYALSVSTGGRVAKRPTWRLDLRAPGGTLRRSLWVAREGGLLLKAETYRLDGSLARRERYLRVDETAPDPARLSLTVPDDAAKTALNAPRGAAAAADYPLWVPEGYLPLSVSASGDGATTVVYGDGAGTFSVVESPAGSAPSGRIVALGGGRTGALFEKDGAPALAFRAGAKSYVIAGALIEDELARVAESLGRGR